MNQFVKVIRFVKTFEDKASIQFYFTPQAFEKFKLTIPADQTGKYESTELTVTNHLARRIVIFTSKDVV
jgi:quinol monooxygenase YgiN